MNGKSFVERRLDLDGEPLLIRFEAPAEVPGSDFECRWSIAWPDGDVRHRTFGIDGIQALALAMQAVHDRRQTAGRGRIARPSRPSRMADHRSGHRPAGRDFTKSRKARSGAGTRRRPG
ncbi:DUF6968 family protein [Pseudorhizobium sp. NPDC055634]